MTTEKREPLFDGEADLEEEQSQGELIHKKKAKFLALRDKQKKLKERLQRKRKEEGTDDKAAVAEGSSDDSEDEYVHKN